MFLVAGITVKDDLTIILGPNKVNKNQDMEVKVAITKLLQDDLGLKVLLDGPSLQYKNALTQKLLDSESNMAETLHIELKPSTRRPKILQRLKVRKKSLHRWLQRRVGSTRR